MVRDGVSRVREVVNGSKRGYGFLEWVWRLYRGLGRLYLGLGRLSYRSGRGCLGLEGSSMGRGGCIWVWGGYIRGGGWEDII